LNRTSTIFKSAHRRAFFSAMTVLVALVVVAVPTLAFPPPGGAPADQGSPFNAGDAVPSCPPGADPTSLNTATTGSSVTPVTCKETGGAKNVTVDWIADTVSGQSTDNAWGQGDKSDCYLGKGTSSAAGACVTQVFGIGASKTDLQYHGVGLEKGTDCTVLACPAGVNEATHDYLYSGIKRLQAGGITSSNANYNVEINQKLAAYEPATPICPLATGTGPCNIWRSPGDLTFMTDWGGNQSSCGAPTPAICAYVWIDKSTGTGKTPSPAASTCFNAKTDPCWGLLPGGNAVLSQNAALADGSINSGAADQPFTFSEIAVDLTASGLVPAGTCFNAKDVWAHSRSSSSFTAELKDFIFGNVSLNTCSATSTSLQQRSGPDTVPPTATNVGSAALELTVAPGSWVRDTATVDAGATGNVTFRYYTSADLCNAGTATSGGTFVSTNALSGGTPNTATSATVQFNTVGDFYWRAFYLGDGLSPSASPCNEIVHVVQVNTAISTAPWIYPNDKATITNPNGGGTPTGSVKFRLYDTFDNCNATTPSDTVTTPPTGGLLYREIVSSLPASSPFTVNTSNTSVKVEATAQVYWRVEFTSTNTSQKGRNSLCIENINATLTGDSPGTVGNTP
jgi:hypothetical protein